MFAAFEAGGPLGRWRRRSTRLAGLNCRWNATADAGFVVRPNRSQPRDPSAAIVGRRPGLAERQREQTRA
jgi:hypothetical protein